MQSWFKKKYICIIFIFYFNNFVCIDSFFNTYVVNNYINIEIFVRSDKLDLFKYYFNI